MSVGLRYSVLGQPAREARTVREILQLEEALVTDAGLANSGRRTWGAALLWLAILALVGGLVTRQRQQLARLGFSPIAASEDAVFTKLSSGSCASEGLRPVLDADQCEAAAAQLGLPGLLDVSPTDNAERPEGCYYFRNSTDQTETLWFSTNPASAGKGAETSNLEKGWLREPICRVPRRYRGRRRKNQTVSAEDLRAAGRSFCCFSGPDKEDVCGSCWDNAKAFADAKSDSGKYCAESSEACSECGGAWCGTAAAPSGSEPDASRGGGGPESAATASTSSGHPEKSGSGEAFTMAEFKRRIGATATAQDAFMWLDSGDGAISWRQFHTGSLAFNPPLSDRQARQAFRGLDSNGDDKISKEEFFGAFSAGHFLAPAPSERSRAGAAAGATAGSTSTAPTTTTAASSTSTNSPATTTELPSTSGSSAGTDLEATPPPSPAPSQSAGRGAASPSPLETVPSKPAAAPGVMSGGSPLAAFAERLLATYSSLQDAFAAFDLDGSGCVDSTEFAAATSTLSEPLAGSEARDLFAALDAGRDAVVCADEFFGGLKAGHNAKEHMAGSMTVDLFKERMGFGISPQFAFAALDKAADGCVDFQELSDGRGAFRPPLTSEEVRSAFVGFDSDGSNLIESAEFLRAMSVGHFLPPSDHPTEQLTASEFKQRLGSAPPRAAFLALDRDANGYVGFMEFVGSRKAFMPPLSDLDAQRVFEGMDADRDRRVSLPEFEAVLATERFFQRPFANAPADTTSWTPEAVSRALPPGTPVGAPAPPGSSSIFEGMPPVR